MYLWGLSRGLNQEEEFSFLCVKAKTKHFGLQEIETQLQQFWWKVRDGTCVLRPKRKEMSLGFALHVLSLCLGEFIISCSSLALSTAKGAGYPSPTFYHCRAAEALSPGSPVVKYQERALTGPA